MSPQGAGGTWERTGDRQNKRSASLTWACPGYAWSASQVALAPLAPLVIPRTTHTWPLKLPLPFRLLIWLQAARHRPRLLRPKPRPFKFHSGHDYLALESVLWC